jgi:hypothetical protein
MAYSATDYQLTRVLQNFYARVGGKVTLATGGSTTTAIDTKLSAELESENIDDIFNGGTLVVIEDAGGAAAAPEGEFSRITDYVASTTTLTFSPALTATVASGDRILIAPPDFPVYDMIEVIGRALRDLSEVPKYNTSITTADNQTEYTLPVAVKGGRILKVEIQGITTDANDNRWIEIPYWVEEYAAAGTAGVLRIKQYTSGYNIRITYKKWHPRVTAFSDYIDEYYHPTLVDAAVFAHALQWRNDTDRMAGGADPEKAALEQKAWTLYDRAKMEHTPSLPPKNFSPYPSWQQSYEDFRILPPS